MIDRFLIPVDYAVFINLDDRTDRLAHMEFVLRNCPWPVERVAGVRLTSVEETNGEVGKNLAVLGIWRSHQKALQRGRENLREGALVLLQDDVWIDEELFRSGIRLPQTLPEDWEVVLVTPRYRLRKPDGGPKWRRKPFGYKPVSLRSAYKTYIVNGAHFCVFRNRAAVDTVLSAIEKAEFRTNFDRFLALNFRTYGVHLDVVKAGHLGSDNE